MENRTRTNRIEFCLNEEEQKIFDKKFELSGMKSRAHFLRKLILYGFIKTCLQLQMRFFVKTKNNIENT